MIIFKLYYANLDKGIVEQIDMMSNNDGDGLFNRDGKQLVGNYQWNSKTSLECAKKMNKYYIYSSGRWFTTQKGAENFLMAMKKRGA